MECHALHGFGASASLGGEASGRPGGLHELGLLGGFGVGLTTSLGGVANLALFLAPPGDVVGWALCFDRGFGLWGFGGDWGTLP